MLNILNIKNIENTFKLSVRQCTACNLEKCAK